MNFFIYFAIAYLIYFPNLTQSKNINIFVQPQFRDEKLIKSICKILNDAMNRTVQTKDILLGNLGSELRNFDINEVARCLISNHPVIVTDFEQKITNKYLRKASFAVFVFNNTHSVWKIYV